MEESFETLQIGTKVYTNVTITTKTKAYVFILHSTGMTNIRVADLPTDVKEKLGYGAEHQTSKSASTWAKKTMASLEAPQIKGVQQQLAKAWGDKTLPVNLTLPELNTSFFIVLGAVLLFIHLFFSYCCMLICQKTGAQPSIIVFIPILQWIPLLKAAEMSLLWLLALFVPVVNFVAWITWCFKIVKARNKSGWLVLFLILPVTNLFAFLYLAFSDAEPAEKQAPRVQMMTLETA